MKELSDAEQMMHPSSRTTYGRCSRSLLHLALGASLLTVAAPSLLLSCADDGGGDSAAVSPGLSIPDPDTTAMQPRVAERIKESRLAVRRDTGSAEAWGTFGMVCDIHGLHEEAIVAYRQAARLDGEDFRWPYFLGMMLDQQGVDADQIAASLQRAAELEPDYAPLHVRLGDAAARLGRNEQAADAYERAIQLDPELGMAHRRLGEIQLQMGQPEEALRSLLKAEELMPEDAGVYIALGRAYMQLDRPEQASEASQKAGGLRRVINVPDPVRSRVASLGITSDLSDERATLLMKAGRFAEAIENLKVKEEVEPDDADVHLRLGTCYLQTEQPREAERHFTKVLKIDPDRAQAHLGLGIVAISAGEVERAERHLRRSLELDDTQASAYARLAVVQAQQGKLDQALQSLQRASELGPLDARAHYNWGRMLLQVNRVEEAAERLESAVAQHPEYTDAHFLLGAALEALARREEAMAHYRKVLELQPRHRGATQRLHDIASQADG